MGKDGASKGEDLGCLNRLSFRIEAFFSKAFFNVGRVVSRHPLVVVLVCLLVTVGFGIRFFLPFDTETDGENLYTPQDSIAFAQRIVVEEEFGFAPVRDFIYLKSRTSNGMLLAGDNTNNQNALQDLLTAFTVLNTTMAAGISFADRCVRYSSGGACDTTSLLPLFNYSMTDIANDPDVLGTINTALAGGFRNDVGRLVNVDQLLGDVETDGSGDVTRAGTLVFTFLLDDQSSRVNGDLEEDTRLENFEIALAGKIRGTGYILARAFALFRGDTEDASDGAVEEDVALLPIGYILLVVYSTIVLSSSNPVKSYGSMGVISFASVGLAILGMLGMGLAFQVPYNLVIQASFFLLAGLGVDDSFVIMAAHKATPLSWSPARRLCNALARAGVSIFFTTVTDVAAFASGTSSTLPAIKYFCVYTLIGVILDFVLQITFFAAFLYWNSKREAAGRADFLVCLKPKENADCLHRGDYKPDRKPFSETFFGETLPNVILHPVGKAVVLVIFIALAGSSLAAALKVDTRFDIEWFIPAGSGAQNALDLQRREFGGRPSTYGVFTGNVNYTSIAVQEALDAMTDELASNQYTRDCDDAWWPSFQSYAEDEHSADTVSIGGESYVVPSEFYSIFDQFLADTRGARFVERFIRNSSAPGSPITLADTTCTFVDVSASGDQVVAMESVRSISASYSTLSGPPIETKKGTVTTPFAYRFEFLFYDGLAVIREEIVRNILIAAGTVAIVTTIVLAKPTASFLILVILGAVYVNVLGFMFYTDIDYNSVSAVNIVIAVALAIDGSVHICHAFLNASGTRDERARTALKELGGATFNGAFSTWLAVVPLATAVSYIFEVFFKLISLILLFATFHAIVVLPVILSLIGPEAHPADFRAKMDALYENEGDEGAAEHGGKAGAAEAGDHGAKEEKRSSSSSSPSVAVASV